MLIINGITLAFLALGAILLYFSLRYEARALQLRKFYASRFLDLEQPSLEEQVSFLNQIDMILSLGSLRFKQGAVSIMCGTTLKLLI